MMNINQIIEQHWQRPHPVLRLILSPCARLFAKIVAKRRARYRSGSLNVRVLPVPVIVVGNLHAGGTGKTPITAALVAALQARGVNVGIISRGYGRTSRDIHLLNQSSTAQEAGDEPLLLFRQTHAPCAVGADRYAAGMALLAAHPEIQVIVSDDGLQHYALARTVEICVFPAVDVGREDLDVLPNGALREPLSRLEEVDFIVISQADADTPLHFKQPEKVFRSHIRIGQPYRFHAPHDTLSPTHLTASSRCIAIAAIARPQRFFDALIQQGFVLQEMISLPDHQTIAPHTLPNADYVFITEKDAVKLNPNATESIWVLPIQADIAPEWVDAILQKIRNCPVHQMKSS